MATQLSGSEILLVIIKDARLNKDNLALVRAARQVTEAVERCDIDVVTAYCLLSQIIGFFTFPRT